MNRSAEDASAEDANGSLLSSFMKLIVANRAVIGLSLFVCVALNFLGMASSQPSYKVEALLVVNSDPVSNMRQAAAGGISAMLGDGATSTSEVDEFQSLLASPELAATLEKKYHLVREVFWKYWDSENNTWKPLSLRDRVHYSMVRTLGGATIHNPTYYDLSRFLSSNVKLDRAQMGAVMSISMQSDQPEAAKRWLSIIIYQISDIIRSNMIAERESYINYLQQQIAQPTLASSRDAIIGVLADQYRSLMVLRSAKTYPLRQIQSPTAGDYPTNKSVSLTLLIGVIAGLLLAGILISFGISDDCLAKHIFLRKEKKRAEF